MQKFCLIVLLCIVECSTSFAKDFKAIKKGMTKAQVLKSVGKPSKILQSKDKNHQYYIWYTKTQAHAVLLHKNTVDGDVFTFETLIRSIDKVAFADLAQLGQDIDKHLPQNTPPAEQKTQQSTTSTNIDTSQIHIEVLEAKKTTLMLSEEEEAGLKLKIKNNTNKTITAIKIKVHFLDTEGQVFYDLELNLTNILKPNYSIRLPEGYAYYTTSGLDTDEWDEGEVTTEILHVEFES